MALQVVAVLLLCATFTVAQTEVNIPSLGSLQGATGESFFTNRTFYQFLGVPYAERPVRFQPPSKKLAWEGVLNVTSYGRACPQSGTESNGEDLEDCLFLDVYTPNLSTESKMPVYFFIHGGGFVSGSSQVAKPGFLMEKDVVLVSIQYRLGAFGYLSLRTEEIPGNAGMFDQVMALQWVYDNIQYFGGDPTNIVVSGQSAGGASTGLLYVSPMTEGLISKVIPLSGSALTLFAVGTEPVRHSLGIASYAGCANNDEIVTCLQNLDPLVLVNATTRYSDDQKYNAHSGMAGLQTMIDGKFMPAMPLDILQNSSFKARPMLTTTVQDEGLLLKNQFQEYVIEGNNLTTDTWALKYRLPDLLLSFVDTKDTACTIATAITDEYFKPGQLGNYTASIPAIQDFLGAGNNKGPARKFAELNRIRGGDTYLGLNAYSIRGDGTVLHGDDLNLIFPMAGYQYKDEDLKMSKNLTEIFTTFMYTGAPGIAWDQYSVETGAYLVINSTSVMKSPFELEYFSANRGIP